MTEKKSIGENLGFKDKVLKFLLEDPTVSIRDMALKLKTYRQKIWRNKKMYEEDHVIWGYTAVVDESKFGHVMYLVLMKMKPMSDGLVDLMTRRIKMGLPNRQKIRLINVLYVNGRYDFIVMFTAADHAIARRYFDSIRIAYDDYLIEKPAIIDVNFSLVREGKRNPEIDKLNEFIPLI